MLSVLCCVVEFIRQMINFFIIIIDNNYHYTIITLLFGGKVLNSHTFYYCFCNFQERFYRLALNLVSKLKTEKHKSH